MISCLGLEEDKEREFKAILTRVEKFKSWRNAMAHGLDVTEEPWEGVIKVEVVSRSGKEKIVEITPESHREKYSEAEKLLMELEAAVNSAVGI